MRLVDYVTAFLAVSFHPLCHAQSAATAPPTQGIFDMTEPPARPPATQPANTEEKPRSVAQVIAESVRPSTCRVIVYGANGQPKGFGSGFVVTDDGFIVTNEHVVEGATSIRIEFPDEGLTVPAELWQVRSTYDLALLKIDSTTHRPLALAPTLPLQAQEVYALGFPLSQAATLKVTRGIVSSTVDWDEFSALLRRRLVEYARDICFLQIDCTINSGNSGGPLIDEQGQVLGVNTLTYLHGESMHYAVSARHVNDIVRQRPAKPQGFSIRAEPAEPTERLPTPARAPAPISFPDSIKAEQWVQTQTKKRTPDSLRTLLLDLVKVRRAQCSGCEGDGVITWRVRVGTRNAGTVSYPIMENRSKPCDECNRTGRVPPKQMLVRQTADRAIQAFAELDPELTFQHPGMQDVARRWEAVVFENVILFGNMHEWMVQAIRAPQRGKSVLALASVVAQKEIDGINRYLLYAGQPKTYFVSGQLHETRVTGDRTILVGVMGDTVEADGNRFIIVHGGLLIDAPMSAP